MPNKQNQKDKIQKIKTDLEIWVKEKSNRSFMFDRACSDLKASIEADFANIGVVLESLSSLAAWYGSIAVSKASNDVNESFANFINMFYCGLLRLKSSEKLYHKSRKSGFRRIVSHLINKKSYYSFTEHTKLLANALSLNQLADAEKIGERVLRLLQEERYFGVNDSKSARFILEVYCKWKDYNFPNNRFNVDIAEEHKALLETIKNKKDNSLLEGLIVKACDYHIRHSGENNNKETKEFSDPIYILFPTEILAVIQIKRLFNFPIQRVNHFLIENYLDFYKIKVSVKIDPVLEQLNNRLDKDLIEFQV